MCKCAGVKRVVNNASNVIAGVSAILAAIAIDGRFTSSQVPGDDMSSRLARERLFGVGPSAAPLRDSGVLNSIGLGRLTNTGKRANGEGGGSKLATYDACIRSSHNFCAVDAERSHVGTG